MGSESAPAPERVCAKPPSPAAQLVESARIHRLRVVSEPERCGCARSALGPHRGSTFAHTRRSAVRNQHVLAQETASATACNRRRTTCWLILWLRAPAETSRYRGHPPDRADLGAIAVGRRPTADDRVGPRGRFTSSGESPVQPDCRVIPRSGRSCRSRRPTPAGPTHPAPRQGERYCRSPDADRSRPASTPGPSTRPECPWLSRSPAAA